jgi:hypothetical protein
MFTLDHFPDNAPRYPDRIAVCAPRGTRAQVRRAAEAEQVSVPEFVRRAIERHVAAVLGGDGPNRPQPPLSLVA